MSLSASQWTSGRSRLDHFWAWDQWLFPSLRLMWCVFPAGEDSKSSLPQSGWPGERCHAAFPERSDLQPRGFPGKSPRDLCPWRDHIIIQGAKMTTCLFSGRYMKTPLCCSPCSPVWGRRSRRRRRAKERTARKRRKSRRMDQSQNVSADVQTNRNCFYLMSCNIFYITQQFKLIVQCKSIHTYKFFKCKHMKNTLPSIKAAHSYKVDPIWCMFLLILFNI